MPDRPCHVLFLCTGNSARSILAESILGAVDPARFRGFSAGSRPAGRVNPYALDLLAERGLPVDGLRSKNWEEFAVPGAPEIDLVITVCDSAAAEGCPVWPGGPMRAHWGLRDPAAVEGDDEAKRRAFRETFVALERRISALLALPLGDPDRRELQRRIALIGKEV